MASGDLEHNHLFLGSGHERNERRTWIVIGLCGAMMVLEIVGGLLFGSIALVADGLHMSTHAGALLLAALAYTFSRRYAHDPRFSFGTGKLGDLAGFTSAIVLAMISLLIGWEAVQRLVRPVPIHFGEAIPIAGLGLIVNIASAWLLGGGHDHHHGHVHGADHGSGDAHALRFAAGDVELSIFEDDVPPRFRLQPEEGFVVDPSAAVIETFRPDGSRQVFRLAERDGFLESHDEIPEPHAFAACVRIDGHERLALFREHDHGHHHRDNNMRAAVVHVLADAAVSVLVIAGLLAASLFGWLWMDPLAGIVGALVIASWSYGLIRDTGSVLLDMNPDRSLADLIRHAVEAEGDRVYDLHLWRLGPGHLGAILAVEATGERDADFYKAKFDPLPAVSHLTVEVRRPLR